MSNIFNPSYVKSWISRLMRKLHFLWIIYCIASWNFICSLILPTREHFIILHMKISYFSCEEFSQVSLLLQTNSITRRDCGRKWEIFYLEYRDQREMCGKSPQIFGHIILPNEVRNINSRMGQYSCNSH